MGNLSTLLLSFGVLLILNNSTKKCVEALLLGGSRSRCTHDEHASTVLGAAKRNRKRGGFGFGKSVEAQQARKEDSRVRYDALTKVSSNPLVFVVDDFLDAASCEAAESSPTVQRAFREKVAATLFDGQSGAMDGLRFNGASSADENNNNDNDDDDGDDSEGAATTATCYPDGLHVDTNNGMDFRHVTCILYLNDVPPEAGGATVFPLSGLLPDDGGDPDDLLGASVRMLREDIGHTRSCGTVRRSGERRQADADAIEHFAGEGVVRVQPKAGRLCVFFSRTWDGSVDPLSWHGGERLRPAAFSAVGERRRRGREGRPLPTEKRILTLFKQVDYGSVPPIVETTFELFLAPQIREQRLSLEAKALRAKP